MEQEIKRTPSPITPDGPRIRMPSRIENFVEMAQAIPLSPEQREADDHNKKHQYGQLAFNIAKWYLVIVGVFMLSCLVWNMKHGTIFSDKVIIAILTTTTTTVIGLPYIVLRGSFEAKEEKINKTK